MARRVRVRPRQRVGGDGAGRGRADGGDLAGVDDADRRARFGIEQHDQRPGGTGLPLAKLSGKTLISLAPKGASVAQRAGHDPEDAPLGQGQDGAKQLPGMPLGKGDHRVSNDGNADLVGQARGDLVSIDEAHAGRPRSLKLASGRAPPGASKWHDLRTPGSHEDFQFPFAAFAGAHSPGALSRPRPFRSRAWYGCSRAHGLRAGGRGPGRAARSPGGGDRSSPLAAAFPDPRLLGMGRWATRLGRGPLGAGPSRVGLGRRELGAWRTRLALRAGALGPTLSRRGPRGRSRGRSRVQVPAAAQKFLALSWAS